jgi:HNH endonuclease/Homing endonuclease associated repeat
MPRSPAPPFEIHYRPRNTPHKALIADLQRVARENDDVRVTVTLYGDKGRFGTNTLMRCFGSWNAALAAASLPIIHFWNVPDRALFENLAIVWRKLGRQPTGREMTKDNGVSRFALSTYKKRFGTWHNGLRAFAEFIASGRRTGGLSVRKDSKQRTNQRGRARAINWRLRATVLIRDNCLCRMCGASPAKDPSVTLHVDHIKPWSKGGATTLSNLQTLCAACNIGKSDR